MAKTGKGTKKEDILPSIKTEERLLDDIQLHFHGVHGGVQEKVQSRLGGEMVPCAWTSHFTEFLETSSNSSDDTTLTVKFKTNPKCHYLTKLTMVQKIPTIMIKPEYTGKVEICWTQNLGHKMIINCNAVLTETECPGFDDIYLDIFNQGMKKRDYKEYMSYQRDIGNVSALIQWNNFLPSDTIEVELPFSFCQDDAHGFPLFPFGLPDTSKVMEINISVHLKISNLLRMRIKDASGGWLKIEDESEMTKYIVSYDKIAKFNHPVCEAKYGMLSMKELKLRQEYLIKNPYILMEDVYAQDRDDPITYGSHNVEVNYPFPARWVAFVAENCQAHDEHNYSNYTTNSEDNESGFTPIESIVTKYGSATRVPELPTKDYGNRMFREAFGTAPDVPGYALAVYWGTKSAETVFDTSINPDKIKLNFIVKLNDTNPFIVKGIDKKTATAAAAEDDDMSESMSVLARSSAKTGYSNLPQYNLKLRMGVYKLFMIKDAKLYQVENDMKAKGLDSDLFTTK